jgi:16S rRNA (uracil1498-N3)-methyltransferase
MTRRCFFVPEIASDAKTFDLPPRLSRQLEGVLRAKVGESIELLDGLGSAWECRITAIRRGIVSVSLTGRLDRPLCESSLAVTLGVGIARSDTMDLVVRQATEVGVFRLAVFRAARSQYGLGGKPAEKRKERWSKIASEAICQCGRTRVPEIDIFDDLDGFLTSLGAARWQGETAALSQPVPGFPASRSSPALGGVALESSEESATEHTLKIFALERESGNSLRGLRNEMGPDIRRVLAVLGPEGGWDKLESSALIAAGFIPVSLGPRTLRLETAAVALVSSIQLLWGDMS